MRSISAQFFDLPTVQKVSARRTSSDHNRGFFPFGVVALAKSTGRVTPLDRKELFSIGRELGASTFGALGKDAATHFAPNYWPHGFEQMPGVWTQSFEALSVLSERLMRMFALALSLPEHHFDEFIDLSPCSLAAVNYFDTNTQAENGQLRAGEHTDYGTLTVLLSENKPGGLQVKTRSGEWIDALVECIPSIDSKNFDVPIASRSRSVTWR